MQGMVSGADNPEFQTKLHYLVNYASEHVTKPFELSIRISKKYLMQVGLCQKQNEKQTEKQHQQQTQDGAGRRLYLK